MRLGAAAEKYLGDKVAQHLKAEFKNAPERIRAMDARVFASGMPPKGEGGFGLSRDELPRRGTGSSPATSIVAVWTTPR